MTIKPKKSGLGLDIKTFAGSSGTNYIVFRTKQGAFHVFSEVEAKEAANDCGAKSKGNSRDKWKELWVS